MPRGVVDDTETVMLDVTVPRIPGEGDAELNVAVIPVIDADVAPSKSEESNPLTKVRKIVDAITAPGEALIEAGSDEMAKSGAVVGEVK
jgi:hypothetical protein